MGEAQYAAFLDLIKKPDTNYVGAVLVTDFFGVPIEFRCTHPVKPDGNSATTLWCNLGKVRGG